MHEIRRQVRLCRKCGKEYRGRSATGIGSEEPNGIFFIAMNPWTHKGKFKNGRGITILLKKLKEWQFTNYFLDNVVKCQMPKGKPTLKHAENCREYLDKQINILKPNYIIIFGEFAARAMGYSYRPWSEVERFKIITIPHFSSILYPRGMNKDDYYKELRKLLYTRYKQLSLF